MRRAGVVAVLALGLAVVAGTAPGAPALAQESTTTSDTVTLDRVEDLVEAGRTDDARAVLVQWWSDVRPKASSRDTQRGLWLRARLTVDPDQAALDYRRLAVRYPGGPYSAQALSRLARAAWASGDSAEAARYVTRLAREYPGNSIGSDAQAWLAAAGSPPPPPPPTKKDTVAAVPSAPATPSTAEAPRPAGAATGVTGVTGGRYSVQLGAFSSAARARNVQRTAHNKGFEARLVRLPGSRLIHVRVGRFDSGSAARELLKRLEAKGFTAAVVTDANREERNRP